MRMGASNQDEGTELLIVILESSLPTRDLALPFSEQVHLLGLGMALPKQIE